MEETQAGWERSKNSQYTCYPTQMDSIAQALGPYTSGAGMNDISIDQ